LVFIFAGYADLLRNTVFKAQPGLERRFSIIVEIEGYTGEELFSIFEYQLQKKGFTLSDKHSAKPGLTLSDKKREIRKLVRLAKKKQIDKVEEKVIDELEILISRLAEEEISKESKEESKENKDKIKEMEENILNLFEKKISLESTKRYKLSDKERIKNLIIENKDKFTAFGGDTSKLVSQIEILHATYNWMDKVGSCEISYDCVNESLDIVMKNKVFRDIDDKAPPSMYN